MIRTNKIAFANYFVLFITAFALVFGTLIYWRESSLQGAINYGHVILWQFIIWIPWLVFLLVIHYFNAIPTNSKPLRILFLAAIGILIIALHFGWFYIISKNISPYLGAPATKYGVYPYFFIFWTFIDIVILSVLVVYVQKGQNNDTISAKIKTITIPVRKGNLNYLLTPPEINWIGSNGYYVDLHTNKGTFMLRKPLKSMMKVLPENEFLRIHRSTIVNITFIEKFKRSSNGSGGLIYLKDGNNRKISRSYVRPLKETLKHLFADQ